MFLMEMGIQEDKTCSLTPSIISIQIITTGIKTLVRILEAISTTTLINTTL